MRKAHPREEASVERIGVGPGDGGPCPICGKEMAEKEYDGDSFFPTLNHKVKGRYWHMVNEHQIWEHYKNPKGI